MRQPLNVVVFPFRRTRAGVEYAVFRRSDEHGWRSVSGGVEDDESLVEAARREATEETGFSGRAPLFELDMVSGAERVDFAAAVLWPRDLYIVRKYFFGMDVTEEERSVVAARGRGEFAWLEYPAAYAALRFNDDRTALWELATRIGHCDLTPL